MLQTGQHCHLLTYKMQIICSHTEQSPTPCWQQLRRNQFLVYSCPNEKFGSSRLLCAHHKWTNRYVTCSIKYRDVQHVIIVYSQTKNTHPFYGTFHHYISFPFNRYKRMLRRPNAISHYSCRLTPELSLMLEITMEVYCKKYTLTTPLL